MKRIKISNFPEYILVDDIDYERVAVFSWCISSTFRTINTTIGGKTICIGSFVLNDNSTLEVDHKNRNIYNNQRHNLRRATRLQNNVNVGPKRNGYKGVVQYKNRFRAEIRINKNKTHLGYFSTEEEAARVYDKKAKEIYGEFAYLNFPEANL